MELHTIVMSLLCYGSLYMYAIYPTEKHDLQVIHNVIYWSMIYAITISVPSFVKWFEHLHNIDKYNEEIDNLKYKLDLLQERVNSQLSRNHSGVTD
jgi:hypothetical protein